jgi:transcriptional regulator with XRE-family HTH domain
MVMELGRRRLREPSAYLREKYGVSISELATLTGLDRTSLHSMFTGRRQPMYTTMLKVSEALGITVTALDAALQEFQASSPQVYVIPEG